MNYLIDPNPVIDGKSLCAIDICRRLSIEPVCPPRFCPIKR